MILEGQSDVALFRVWFQELQEDFEFCAAEDVVRGGGCTAVGAAVAESTNQAIPAIGIVDRDYLHREKKWEILFSIDPSALIGAADHPEVRVTSLWEIEAYLLRPELLGSWVGVQHTPQPAPSAKVQRAMQVVVEECEGLLNAASFYASGHDCGIPYDLRHFAGEAAPNLADRCRALLGRDSQARRDSAVDIEAHLDAVRAGLPEDHAERLVYLLQYVDTKRLLYRLKLRLSLGADAHHALAILMADRGLRPEELHEVLVDASMTFNH